MLGHPQMLRGAFKSFNPLETSTGFLLAVIRLEEHFWNRKRRKNIITQTLQSTVGVRSVWTRVTQGLAHAKSHQWQEKYEAAFRNTVYRMRLWKMIKSKKKRGWGFNGKTGQTVRDRHAGALNKEPLPGYLIIVSHQWPKWMNEWMDVSGHHA